MKNSILLLNTKIRSSPSYLFFILIYCNKFSLVATINFLLGQIFRVLPHIKIFLLRIYYRSLVIIEIEKMYSHAPRISSLTSLLYVKS